MSDLSPIMAEFTSYTDKLIALRDHLAETLEEASPSVAAPLAKQLMDVLARLEAVAPTKTKSVLDELAEARANRRANAGL